MARPKILLAEDDSNAALLAIDYLQCLGCEVSHAEDGLQALEMLGCELDDELSALSRTAQRGLAADAAGTRVTPDLIVVDCQMPYVDGLTLATKLSADERYAKVPVVVLTSKAKMEEPFRQLPTFKGFFVKGSGLDGLRKAIESALGPLEDPGAYDRPRSAGD